MSLTCTWALYAAAVALMLAAVIALMRRRKLAYYRFSMASQVPLGIVAMLGPVPWAALLQVLIITMFWQSWRSWHRWR